MLTNYIKTAIRNLGRHRFFSFINIFGLAVSMSICMAVIMLVADQMMYDRYNSKRDRIFRINTIAVGHDGGERNETATTTVPVKQELMENFTGVEKSVRIMRGFANNWIEFDQDVNIPVSGYFADPEILDVFEYELEYGDPRTALVEPFSVVLTKQAARKLFKQENPIGESIKVGTQGVFKVTGVLKNSDHKSHIVFEALASMSTVKSLEAEGKREKNIDNWFNYTAGWVYILIEKDKTTADILSQLKKIEEKHFAKLTNPETQVRVRYTLQSLTNITPGAFINNPIGPFLPWIFVYFFAGLSGIVMLTSCFNFTNLSIARSLTRAREIGVRKVTGAMRWQIFSQFLSESVIVALASLAIACVILIALKPMMLQLSFAQMMKWDLELNYAVLGVFFLFALTTGVLAGIFPAVVMSGFQPVKVLTGLKSMRLFSNVGLRKALLVAQFTFSLIFILSVIVVFSQLNMFMRADHGFNMDNKMVVALNNTKPETFKNELQKFSNIKNVSAVSHVLAAGQTYGTNYKRELADKDWTNLSYYSVDEDYLKNLDLSLVAGRFYDPKDATSNKNFIVINERAVEAFQFGSATDAIGQQIIHQDDSSRKEIIGVVKNYNHQLLIEKMDPLALIYNADEYHVLQVAYTGSYEEAAASVEKAWAKINPTFKIDYRDFSDEVHKIYDVFFGDIADILTVISALAIMISCLGLLGMATYTTETRRKEVSIRKILGSSDRELVYLLSKGFFLILFLSIVIAVPAAYFLNNLWLEQLAYHVTVNVPIVIAGIAILLGFGLLTIGSQTWRATFINPVDNLKE